MNRPQQPPRALPDPNAATPSLETQPRGAAGRESLLPVVAAPAVDPLIAMYLSFAGVGPPTPAPPLPKPKPPGPDFRPVVIGNVSLPGDLVALLFGLNVRLNRCSRTAAEVLSDAGILDTRHLLSMGPRDIQMTPGVGPVVVGAVSAHLRTLGIFWPPSEADCKDQASIATRRALNALLEMEQ